MACRPRPCWETASTATARSFARGCVSWGWNFFCKRVADTRLGPIPSRRNESGVRRYVAPGVPPAQTLAEITAAFPAEQWKACSWQAADGQTRRTRLAWCEVYLQHKLREMTTTWNEFGWSWTGPPAKPSLIIMSWLIFISRLAGPVACA